MAKRENVVRFRKRTATRAPRRKCSRAMVKRLLVPVTITGLLIAATGLGLTHDRGSRAPLTAGESDGRAVRVTWVDGDSGRLDDREFRLHGVDAPEGSAQRAQCPQERALSRDAHNAARTITEGQTVRVSRSYGMDSYGRELVDLSAGGRDVADQLVAAGKLKRWNFEAGESKPDWC
jgi:endonuclease YncB( thermonuclease family)